MIKILILMTGLLFADSVSCIKIDDTLTICTNDDTGEETEIWTYDK